MRRRHLMAAVPLGMTCWIAVQVLHGTSAKPVECSAHHAAVASPPAAGAATPPSTSVSCQPSSMISSWGGAPASFSASRPSTMPAAAKNAVDAGRVEVFGLSGAHHVCSMCDDRAPQVVTILTRVRVKSGSAG